MASRGQLLQASWRSPLALSALFSAVVGAGLMAPQAIAATEQSNAGSLSWNSPEALVIAAKSRRSRVRFVPPDNARPRTTVGSGSRGRVRFAPPNAPA
ncbi:MAG: hypothetical protein ACFCBU_10480, partial [Cyanophyceae cyanobacterium]